MTSKYLEINSQFRNRITYPEPTDFKIKIRNVVKNRYNAEDPIAMSTPVCEWNGSLQNNGFSDSIKVVVLDNLTLKTNFTDQKNNNMSFLGSEYKLQEDSHSNAGEYKDVSFNLGNLSGNTSSNSVIIAPTPNLQIKYVTSTSGSSTNPITRYNRVTKFLRNKSNFYKGMGIKFHYFDGTNNFYCYRTIIKYEYLADQIFPNFNFDSISDFSSSTTEKFIWSQISSSYKWSQTNFINNNLPAYFDCGKIDLDEALPSTWSTYSSNSAGNTSYLEAEIHNPTLSWGGVTVYNYNTEILQSTLLSDNDGTNTYGSIGSKIYIPNAPETNGQYINKYVVNETMRWLTMLKVGNSVNYKSHFEDRVIDLAEAPSIYVPQLSANINLVSNVGSLAGKSKYYSLISGYDENTKIATLNTKLSNNFMPRWLPFWYSTSNNAVTTPDTNYSVSNPNKTYNNYRNGYIQFKSDYIIEDSLWLSSDYYSVRENMDMIAGMRGVYNRVIPNSSWLATTSSSGLPKTSDYYQYATDSNENNEISGNLIYLNTDEKLNNQYDYYKNSYIRFWFNGKTMGVLTAQGQQIANNSGPTYDETNWTEKGDRNSFDSTNWSPLYDNMRILKYYRKNCILKLSNPRIIANNPNNSIYDCRRQYFRQKTSSKNGNGAIIYIESVNSENEFKWTFNKNECDRGSNFTAEYKLNQIGTSSNYYITSNLETVTFSNNIFTVSFTVSEVSEYAMVKVPLDHDLTKSVIQYSAIAFENTFWEILPFSSDNESSINYMGNTQQNQPTCHQIELIELVVPNSTIDGCDNGLPQNYPYFYVLLENVTNKGSTSGTNVLYSNNPNAGKACFRVPVDDFPSDSPYCRFTGNGMVQTIKFKPNETLHIAIYLPDGTLYKTTQAENYSPYPPNRIKQISALFTIQQIV